MFIQDNHKYLEYIKETEEKVNNLYDSLNSCNVSEAVKKDIASIRSKIFGELVVISVKLAANCLIMPSDWENYKRQIDDLFKELEVKVNQGDRVEIENFWMNPNFLCVSDPSPLVMLFGPAASGKTMALIRLTRYLWGKGYQVVPVKTFRPPYDKHYNSICESFPTMCHSQYAVARTMGCNFLLVKVIDRQGRTVCQLMDAPGQWYFDRNMPQTGLPACINRILGLPNKRIWLFFVEPHWDDCNTRQMYVERITQMRSAMFLRDRTIFLSNKIDMHPHLFLSNGMPNNKQIFKNIKMDYPELFTPFENKNPITRLFRKYNSQLVPFSAGSFIPTNTGQVLYTMSNDIYPNLLWKAICNSI